MLRMLFLVVVLALVTVPARASPKYKATILPMDPQDINNKGHVVGEIRLPTGEAVTAAIWTGGKPLDLAKNHHRNLGKLFANRINDLDQVICSSVTSDAITSSDPYFWSRGTLSHLSLKGTGGRHGGSARGVNNRGQIVGVTDSENSEDSGNSALFWSSHKADAQNLGRRFSWRHSTANGINNLGDIAGTYQEENGNWHAFMLSGSRVTDLGTLGSSNQTPEAISINDHREVLVTWALVESPEKSTYHAFVWRKGNRVDLGLMNNESIQPMDMNNRGQVVGYGNFKNEHVRRELMWEERAFLWQDRQMLDLNTQIPKRLGLVLRRATAINDRGQIVGSGTLKGKHVGFLLTPVKTKG